jgi:hypothetical protein
VGRAARPAGASRGLAPRSSGSSHPAQSVPEPRQAPRRHPPETGRPCLPTTVRHAASPLQRGDWLISPAGYPKQFRGGLFNAARSDLNLVGEGAVQGALVRQRIQHKRGWPAWRWLRENSIDRVVPTRFVLLGRTRRIWRIASRMALARKIDSTKVTHQPAPSAQESTRSGQENRTRRSCCICRERGTGVAQARSARRFGSLGSGTR